MYYGKQLLLKKQPKKAAPLVGLLVFWAKSQSQKPNQTDPKTLFVCWLLRMSCFYSLFAGSRWLGWLASPLSKILFTRISQQYFSLT